VGQLVVILIRLIVPISIFRWPLGGALASLLADMLDVVLVDALDMGGFSDYAALDKALDMYYLTFCLIVSLRWDEAIPRWTSIVLFAYRALGFVLFELTQIRVFLFIFPNLFENFYLAYLILKRFLADFYLTPKSLVVLLTVLLIPKLAQEYVLRYAEVKPWGWIKENVLQLRMWTLVSRS
jgi:hypothetical protein